MSWISNITLLSEIAKSQPQAAFSALTHGLLSKWMYFSRKWMYFSHSKHSHLLKPLDNAIRSDLIPALTGRPPPNVLECELFVLPARLGGLGIRLPSKNADREHNSSLLVTSMLKDHILNQSKDYSYVIMRDQYNKANISKQNSERCKEEADRICAQLPPNLQKAMMLAMEKGTSTWLTVLPLAEHGFTLHKSAFQDALALRYGWSPPRLPSKCECGHAFSVDHALSCAKGGFPAHIYRHNKIRDITASLLTEVCSDVRVEPDLQPVVPNQLDGVSANSQDSARLDLSANGVWGGRYEKTFSTSEFSTPLLHPIEV